MLGPPPHQRGPQPAAHPRPPPDVRDGERLAAQRGRQLHGFAERLAGRLLVSQTTLKASRVGLGQRAVRV